MALAEFEYSARIRLGRRERRRHSSSLSRGRRSSATGGLGELGANGQRWLFRTQHPREVPIVRSRRLTFAFAAIFTLGAALAGGGAWAQTPPMPTATPVPLPTATVPPVAAPPTAAPLPAPTAVATSAPRGKRGGKPPASGASPAPTATPTSPAFASLDGTWEVQVQYPDHTLYSYLVIHQKDANLTGSWRTGGKDYPLEGTYDGRLIRLLVKEPTAQVAFSGYVENASDMVGLLDWGTAGKPTTPFTAEHRGQAQPHGLLQKY